MDKEIREGFTTSALGRIPKGLCSRTLPSPLCRPKNLQNQHLNHKAYPVALFWSRRARTPRSPIQAFRCTHTREVNGPRRSAARSPSIGRGLASTDRASWTACRDSARRWKCPREWQERGMRVLTSEQRSRIACRTSRGRFIHAEMTFVQVRIVWAWASGGRGLPFLPGM